MHGIPRPDTVIAHHLTGFLLAAGLCLTATTSAAGSPTKTPSVSLGSKKQQTAEPLNRLVLRAVEKMPRGGGYQTGVTAFSRLCDDAVSWNERAERLTFKPRRATPSFCSEAVYFVFVLALQEWERENRLRFPGGFWQYMRPYRNQADGVRGWGRMNANGPGLAKWAYELRAGVNFTDIRKALPGDFLKIFWTPRIGAREYGHFVIYLGMTKSADGTPLVRFWSSNTDAGYGIKCAALSDCKRLLFTRIVNPKQFAAYNRLPDTDEWLFSLLKKEVSPREMLKRCGIKP